MLILDHLDHWSLANPKSKYKSRAETELTSLSPIFEITIGTSGLDSFSTTGSSTASGSALSTGGTSLISGSTSNS
jgi:hypothetical protein